MNPNQKSNVKDNESFIPSGYSYSISDPLLASII